MGKLNVINSLLLPASPMFSGGAPYDLVSLADVTEELLITDPTQNAWIAKQISKSSDAITQYCNRVFQPQTYQDEIWPFRDPYPWQIPGTLFPLQVSKWPLLSTPSTAGTNPPAAPGLVSIPGGALAAAKYFAKVSLVTATGETAASLESSFFVMAANLLTVVSPPPDPLGLATGWNCYVGTVAQTETLQNASPLRLGQNFTLPASGLAAGSAPPNYMLVIELDNIQRPLIEGIDFLADPALGQLTRLDLIDSRNGVGTPNGFARPWSGLPKLVQYSAGFSIIPNTVQDCAIELVKGRWYGRTRDPNVRQENIEGVYSATYWMGTGPGGPGDLPVMVADRLDRFRVPAVG
jgi:hypothetical protein